MDKEIWLPVKDYEGLYEVSSHGRVKSFDRYTMDTIGRRQFHRGKILKGDKTKFGYIQIGLSKESFVNRFKIHRLVAIAFIPNPENKPEVNHIDGDKLNNKLDNLEWNTSYENINHGIRTGLLVNPVGETNQNAKLSKRTVIQIREKYSNSELSYRNIGEIYNVTGRSISNIINRRSWKHIK